jgi:uncharacterized protein (TIGR02453 family)
MLGELLRESFPGFDKQALKFLKDLKSPSKNNKEWFDKNRDRYETYLREPMKHLIDTLSDQINKIDNDIIVNYKSIFRINRDIRFSKVKTPYKTISSAAFAFYRNKSAEIPQFYFHFSPDEFLTASGQYSMEPENLKSIRRYIFENFDEYESIVKEKKFRKRYGDVQGESLTKVPSEFHGHPAVEKNAELAKALKMKQYYVFETHEPGLVLDERISKIIVESVRLTYDFTKFLTEAIRKHKH